jgi:hypothetical protein
MGILRFVWGPGQESLPEVRALVGRLRDAAARRSGEWACWIDHAGERVRARVQDVDDTGRGFTALVASESLPEVFERFADTTRADRHPHRRGVRAVRGRLSASGTTPAPVTA